MNKVLVVYKSKYGATEKYAGMLQEEFGCDIMDMKEYDNAVLKNYSRIIFAGGIYAGGISGISTLRKNWNYIKDKKTAVFCVGASPFDEKAIEEVKKHSLKGDLEGVPLFYGRGAWDESRMNFKDRTLCKMLQKMVAKQDPSACEPWMKALLSAVGEKCDWTDKKYLIPLWEYMAD